MKRIFVLFVVLILMQSAFGQNLPNDCVNAIVVCGNGNFSSNASGWGAVQEIRGCNGNGAGSEHESLWIKINVVQTGTLGFNLIPNNPSITVDYDFWVFDKNRPCNNLGSPIRCATTVPELAGTPTNHTGMNGSTMITQTGPGADGNGYVRWLNVQAGEFYYIAIDRPFGDGGFQIQWTGSATVGTGAFPTPPAANQIPDYLTCSSTPNIGIFDLNSRKSAINSDMVNNTINFYTSFANAMDGVSPLPGIMANTSNPQKIYAKVVNNLSGCSTIVDFDLRVVPVPYANITVSDTQICAGENVTVHFSGTANTTVEYRVNGGAIETIVLDASGQFQLQQPLTVATTFNLVSAKVVDASNAIICSQIENDAVSVSVSSINPPEVRINAPICLGDPVILSLSGLPNATISYAVNGGTSQTTALDGIGQQAVTLSGLVTGLNQVVILSITDSNHPNCIQSLNIIESFVVQEVVTASVSAPSAICENGEGQVVFTAVNGTAPYTFTYTVNGGLHETITTTTGNSVALNVPNTSPGVFTYTIVDVTSSGNPTCSLIQGGPVSITVNPLPDAFIQTSQNTVCVGGAASVTLTALSGVAPFTFTYTVNEGSSQTISTSGSSATLNVPTAASGEFTYKLISIQDSSAAMCAASINQSVTVNVNPLPDANVVASTMIMCAGTTSPTITFTGLYGTPPFTFTYNLNNGINQTITSSGNSAVINVPSTNSGVFTYTLVGVQDSSSTTCAVGLNKSATVTITAAPGATITNLGGATVCSGNQANIQIIGTPGATINYNINGTSGMVVLPISGEVNLTPVITVATTFVFENIQHNSCVTQLGQSITIAATPMPSGLISYSGPYCLTETASQSVSFTGTPHPNGFYTVQPSGLSINTVTGAILPGNSLPNAYMVYYNVPAYGGCNAYRSPGAPVTILSGPTAAIAYNGSPYCVSTTGAVPVNQTGTAGGNYTSEPSGLFLDASSGAITPSLSTPGTYTVYYTLPAAGGCPELRISTTVVIMGVPVVQLNPGVLCVHPETNQAFSTVTLNSGLAGTAYSFRWFFNGVQVGNSNTYVASEVGDYFLTVTNTAGCSASASVSVQPYYAALSGYAVVSNYFYDTQMITVHVNGASGNYLYSLDGGPFQESNVFQYVLPGVHTITVHDENSCTDFDVVAETVGYPKFFTPNGDGHNETWNITALQTIDSQAQIHVFDRYGKLLKQLSPMGEGWDGTFNGQLLPSSDYWFSVKFIENGKETIFKSHFSLKR